MLEQFNHFFDQLRRTLYGENPWIWVLALLGFSIVAGLIVRALFIRFLRVSHRRQGSVLAGAVLKQLSNRTRVFFPLLIFFILQPLVYLEDPYDDIVFKATEILFFVTVGWLALKLINALEDVAYAYYAEEKHNPFRERKIMPITYFNVSYSRFLEIVQNQAALSSRFLSSKAMIRGC